MIEVETPLFASLPEAALERVRSAVQTRRFAHGDVVVSEGETLTELFIIVRGAALVVGRDWHGEQHSLARLGPGDCFGELSMLSGEPASATVEAATDLEVWALPQLAVSAIASEHPELARNLSALLADRLRRSNERALRAQRGQLVTLLIPGGARWAGRLSYLLARSIAWHTRQPVIFIDTTGVAETLRRHGMTVTSLSAIGSGPRAGALDGSREPLDYLQVIACDEGEAQGSELPNALERGQAHARNVLFVSSRGSAAGAGAAQRAQHVVALAHESELGSLRAELAACPVAPDAKLGVVLFSDRSQPPTVGDLRTAQKSLDGRWRVEGIIPDGAQALDEELGPGTTGSEAIDRQARKIAGLSVGLALGAGGAKGYAHIGVVRVLEAAGVPVDCAAGCSIGAPLAAGVAAGWSPQEIRAALDAVSARAVRPNMPFLSILSSRSMRAELRAVTNDRCFEDLPTPLGIVAVDIETREEVLLRRGPIWAAMLASMAYPGVYEPVRMGARYLVDGGVLNPVPVSAALALDADIVISSMLGGGPGTAGVRPSDPNRRRMILESITRTLEIMQTKIVQESCTRADVAIEPVFDDPPGLLDFRRGRELEGVGEAAAERALPKLRSQLPWLS